LHIVTLIDKPERHQRPDYLAYVGANVQMGLPSDCRENESIIQVVRQ
jgi:hypothetical protein